MPNVRDHDASVYLRLQGDALSVGGYEHNPVFWDDVSNNTFSGWQINYSFESFAVVVYVVCVLFLWIPCVRELSEVCVCVVVRSL